MKLLDKPVSQTIKLSTETVGLEGQNRCNVNATSSKISWRLERDVNFEALFNSQDQTIKTVGNMVNPLDTPSKVMRQSYFDYPANNFYLKLSRDSRKNKINGAHSSKMTNRLADLSECGNTMYSVKAGIELNHFFDSNILGQE